MTVRRIEIEGTDTARIIANAPPVIMTGTPTAPPRDIETLTEIDRTEVLVIVTGTETEMMIIPDRGIPHPELMIIVVMATITAIEII